MPQRLRWAYSVRILRDKIRECTAAWKAVGVTLTLSEFTSKILRAHWRHA